MLPRSVSNTEGPYKVVNVLRARTKKNTTKTIENPPVGNISLRAKLFILSAVYRVSRYIITGQCQTLNLYIFSWFHFVLVFCEQFFILFLGAITKIAITSSCYCQECGWFCYLLNGSKGKINNSVFLKVSRLPPPPYPRAFMRAE